MDEATLGILLLRMLAAVLTSGLAAVSWLTASAVSEGFEVASRGLTVAARITGLFLAALGLLGMIGLAFSGVLVALVQDKFLPHLYIVAVVSIGFALANVWILYRAPRRIPAQFEAWVTQRSPLEEQSDHEFKLGVWMQTPLGIITLLVVAGAAFAGLWTGLSLGMFELPESEFGALICCGIVVAELIVLSGVALLTAVELEAFPENLLTPQERLTLSQLLTMLAIAYLALTAVALSWMGVVIIVLGIILLVSTLGGRKRAAQLEVFWTLTNVLQSGRPAEAEIREQARTTTGQPRRVLKALARRLDEGDDWADVVCRREIAPQSSWLELHGAASSGALAAAMNAAASRETLRFARQSDPTTPRVALGYFGMVATILIAGLGFIGYSIVPKMKKIFEDFGMELPEPTIWLFRMLDSGLIAWIGIFAFLASFFIGSFGELMVDFYGWHGAAERMGLSWSRRRRTPDLLRGLRWGVIRGQPLEASLQAMAAAPASFSIRSHLHQAAAAIREGYDPWETLLKTRWLTKDEVELLQSAQAADNLPWALETLSDSIVSRFDYRLEWWLQLLHPVLVLLFGVLLGIIGVGLLLPLFHLIGALA